MARPASTTFTCHWVQSVVAKLALLMIPTSLSQHIIDIFARGANEQMVRIDAASIIAGMADKIIIRDATAVPQHPREFV